MDWCGMSSGNNSIGSLNHQIKISAIQPELRSAGPGLRTEIFFYGCSRSCPGCINEWVKDEGHFNELTIGEILTEVVRFNNFHITVGGGEPFDQLQELQELLYWMNIIVKDQKGDILLYTGNEWESIKRYESWILRYVDWVVTGPFVKELAFRKMATSFVGSNNQQVIALRDGRFVGVCELDGLGRLQHPISTEQQAFLFRKSLIEEQPVE
jgi:anaerobic ribonucleoside-triphosphate reductase activating protein